MILVQTLGKTKLVQVLTCSLANVNAERSMGGCADQLQSRNRNIRGRQCSSHVSGQLNSSYLHLVRTADAGVNERLRRMTARSIS